MTTPKEMDRIINNVIEVLIKLDKDMQNYDRISKDFAMRLYGIDKVLTKVEENFGEGILVQIICTIQERIGHALPLDYKMAGRLIEHRCPIPKIRSMHSFYLI